MISTRRLRTKYKSEQIVEYLSRFDSSTRVVMASKFSLSWFVEKVFRTPDGSPLRLFPFQQVLLEMLWHKKFPMVIMTRGGGKCQSGTTLVQVSDGLYRFDELIDPNSTPMTEIPIDMDAIGENGPNRIGYGWNNGFRDTKIIKTQFGFECENTPEHKIRIIRDGNISWVESKDIVIGDIVPIVRTPFQFGSDQTLSEDQSWFLGATVGDGMVSQKTKVHFTNKDQDLIKKWSRIGSEWSGKQVYPDKSGTSFQIYSRSFSNIINNDFGLKNRKAHFKEIPLIVRRSPRNIVASFLSGLFDTDGGMTKKGFEFSTVSEELSRQVQTCLLGFGILSKRREKFVKYKDTRRKAFILTVNGSNNLALLKTYIGFSCKRKQVQLEELCLKTHNTNIDLLPHSMVKDSLLRLSKKFKEYTRGNKKNENFVRKLLSNYRLSKYEISYDTLKKILSITNVISDDADWKKLNDIANSNYFFDTVVSVKDGHTQTYDVHIPEDHTFIANGFISHNSFLLGLYALLRAMLCPGSKIIISGGGFRQAKVVFKYIEGFYNYSPILQKALSAYGKPTYASDNAYLNVGSSTITAIPIGDGEKIRGMRATVLLVDEMASVPEDIFETVLTPFTAVNVNPRLSNAYSTVIRKLKGMGADEKLLNLISEAQGFGNQIVISGTASYKHNHFYKRYKLYKYIIESNGDREKLKDALEAYSLETTGTINNLKTKDINTFVETYKHYCVVQMPYHGLPEGMLDEDTIATQTTKMMPSVFAMEYLAQFPEDTDGFFRRSIVESATPKSPIDTPVEYELYGDPRASYVLGLDPARHNDNFGAVVLKITSRGLELVHCQAWNKLEWNVCASKIKEICRRFNIVRIAMDKQGGGDAVAEWLARPTSSFTDADTIWPVPEQITDPVIFGAPGKRILELVNYSSSWTADNVYNLASLIQQKALLFPYRINENYTFDQFSLFYGKKEILSEEEKTSVIQDLEGISEIEAKSQKGVKASLGVKGEVDECINELCSIVRTVNANGSEKFDLPTIAQNASGDARRRDRFSALLLASYAAKVHRGTGIVLNIPVPGGKRKNKNSRYTITRRGSVSY